MQDKLVTYVYDSKEVYLTGRIASPQGNSKKATMVEVLPVGADKNDTAYAKWVNINDLLVVKDLENEDIEYYETE